MPALTRTKKPDADALYEPVTDYADAEGHVYHRGTRLQGDHPAVRAAFGRWMLSDLPDNEKGQRRAETLQPLVEESKQHGPPPLPVAQPPSGRFRAVRSWQLADPDLQQRAQIHAGDIVDASDKVYRRYPHLFVRLEEQR